MTLSTAIVIAVTLLTPLLNLAAVPADQRLLYLVSTGILLIGATLGVPWAEQRRSPKALYAVLAALCVLAAVTVWASNDVAWQVVMPLISLFVLFGSVHLGVVVMGLYLVEVAWLTNLNSLQGLATCGGFVASSAFVIVFSLILRREREARAHVERLATDLEEANARLRSYATQIEDLATAKERNRLAREIHDSLGHYLTVVHVQIEAAKTQLERDPAVAQQCLARAAKLTQDGLTEVRRSVALLRSSPTEQRPLTEAVTGLVEEICASGIDASLVIRGAPCPLAPAVEFTLYRAVQESLTNIRRHAGAKHAQLELDYARDLVTLHVRDDGVGARDIEGGFGLLGLRERVHLVGGTVAIDTALGCGFALAVRVPL